MIENLSETFKQIWARPLRLGLTSGLALLGWAGAGTIPSKVEAVATRTATPSSVARTQRASHSGPHAHTGHFSVTPPSGNRRATHCASLARSVLPSAARALAAAGPT